MPKQKNLKRLIRARMEKTGESYTTARLHILTKRSVTPPVARFAELAGMSDRAVESKTGKTWPDGTSLHVHFTDKGPEKSSVTVQHVELASQKAMNERKQYWVERLASLAEVVT